ISISLTGPTGSGKSTTISALLNYINARKKLRVITLEDPIEYLLHDDLCDFNQREYRTDFNSFADGLRAALRQDPDLIMVGEMREVETIKMGLMAAETGHMVVSTLHTVSSAETVERIVSAFPGDEQQQVREQFCNCCCGIMSQQLIKKVKGEGVVPVREILIFNHPIRNLILTGNMSQVTHYLEVSPEKGMNSLNQALEKAYSSKLITYDNAIACSAEPDTLKERLDKLFQ
ncbi:type IV pilus twitching motility protein PilT, partial [Candidatus Riflebacteria bacterium]